MITHKISNLGVFTNSDDLIIADMLDLLSHAGEKFIVTVSSHEIKNGFLKADTYERRYSLSYSNHKYTSLEDLRESTKNIVILNDVSINDLFLHLSKLLKDKQA